MRSRQRKQIEMHQGLAEEYDLRYAPAFSKLFQRYWNGELLRRMNLAPGSKVLDLGCGTGILLASLADEGYRAVGTDISRTMLSRARGTAPLVTADGGNLPFADASLDAVLARGSIHHMQDIPAVLGEILRVLRHGGQVVLSEPSNDFYPIRAARSLMYKKSRHFDREDIAFRSVGFESMMLEAGFVQVKLDRFGFLAYALAGFPDVLPVLKYVPFSAPMTRWMISVDRLLARTPVVSSLGFHLIAVGVKP